MNIVSTTIAVRGIFDTVTSSDVSVITGWQKATDTGTILTVGLQDRTQIRQDTDDPLVSLTQPFAVMENQIMGGEGWDSHDQETLRLLCSLAIPGDGTESPEGVVERAESIITACRRALRNRTTRPSGTNRAWIPNVSIYLTDASTGYAVMAAFTVAVESYTQ